MNFKTLSIKKNQFFFKKYFEKYGLGQILDKKNFKKRLINEMEDDIPYEPELSDLYLLHQYILKFRRMTVLEFGIGWSSLVMANAININIKKYHRNIQNLRLNNAGQVHCLDNDKKWIKKTKNKTNKYSKIIKYHYSEAYMDKFNDRICTSFKNLPKINPDFIYLDGPDQFHIKGKINSININHNDFMPMSCDILKIEHFLKPGTIIIVDGRGANSRFLLKNFQRNWKYYFNKINDQHIFYLNENPLGDLNRRQLKFYFGKNKLN